MNDFVINSVENVVLVTVNNVKNSAGALADIFTAIGNAHINVDMICQTAPYKDRINLSFSIDNSPCEYAVGCGRYKKDRACAYNGG